MGHGINTILTHFLPYQYVHRMQICAILVFRVIDLLQYLIVNNAHTFPEAIRHSIRQYAKVLNCK